MTVRLVRHLQTALGRFGDAADTEGLTVSLKGGMADLLPFAHLVEGLEELEASGSLDLTVHAAGALEAPRVEATLAVVDVSATVPDMPPARPSSHCARAVTPAS